MIVGIGSDLCEIERVADAIANRGKTLINRLFTPTEQARASAASEPAAIYATCFATKEACSKALGTGITERVRWTDIELLIAAGRPYLHLTGAALRRARRLTGGGVPKTHLSIACRDGLAAAFVLIEAV
ncbi:holo-[acyl-carrier protein] synthase [Bradyrhizobium sp. USDA 4472]